MRTRPAVFWVTSATESIDFGGSDSTVNPRGGFPAVCHGSWRDLNCWTATQLQTLLWTSGAAISSSHLRWQANDDRKNRDHQSCTAYAREVLCEKHARNGRRIERESRCSQQRHPPERLIPGPLVQTSLATVVVSSSCGLADA